MSTVEESFRAKQQLYAPIEKNNVDAFVDALMALARGYEMGNGVIHVTNETPNDMDGLVFKVTIT